MGDNLLGGAFSNAGNNLINATRKDGDNPAVIRLFLSLLLILIIVGCEGMKVIFRNNFGKHGISISRLIICACCFAAISYFGDSFFSHPGQHSMIPVSNSFSIFLGRIIFAALSVFVLIKGFVSYIKAVNEQPNSDYRGDSYLLRFLEPYGYNQNLIQNLVEPLYVSFIGVLLWLFCPFGGITIIFCGLSIWFNLLIDLMVGNYSSNQQQGTISNQAI